MSMEMVTAHLEGCDKVQEGCDKVHILSGSYKCKGIESDTYFRNYVNLYYIPDEHLKNALFSAGKFQRAKRATYSSEEPLGTGRMEWSME